MARTDAIDLMFTEDGDLAIDIKTNELATVQKQGYIAQSARNRIKITDPEWIDYEINQIGANLEDLLGMPNTQETAIEGIERIVSVLTRDGLISTEEVYVRPVPVGKYVVAFFVFIKIPDVPESLGFEVLFNLHTGLTIRKV